MGKVIAILRKLGILRFGSVKGTFTSAKNKSDELTFDRVYDAKKDLTTKEDINKIRNRLSGNILIWVVLGGLLLLGVAGYIVVKGTSKSSTSNSNKTSQNQTLLDTPIDACKYFTKENAASLFGGPVRGDVQQVPGFDSSPNNDGYVISHCGAYLAAGNPLTGQANITISRTDEKNKLSADSRYENMKKATITEGAKVEEQTPSLGQKEFWAVGKTIPSSYYAVLKGKYVISASYTYSGVVDGTPTAADKTKSRKIIEFALASLPVQ